MNKNNKIILGSIVGCLLLIFLTCCCCMMSFVLLMRDPSYKAEFDRSYCQELKLRGMRLSEDPLGICNR